jgi:hypothetical protein
MKKHRRKIALALALALAFGSAAASAANYSNGRGALPSFAGASDALELAMSGASNASSWLISRARQSVGSAFSYGPTPAARPPEVPYSPEALPSFPRGGVEPSDLYPRWHLAADRSEPDRIHPATFEEGVNAPTGGPPAVDVTLALPGNGGGGTRASVTPTLIATPGTPTLITTPSTPTPPITSPVPELPPFALLLAGVGLLATLTRRRQRA